MQNSHNMDQDECSGTHNSSPSAWVMKVQIVTVCSSTPSQHFSSIIIVPVSTSRGCLHDEGFIVHKGIPRENGKDTHDASCAGKDGI